MKEDLKKLLLQYESHRNHAEVQAEYYRSKNEPALYNYSRAYIHFWDLILKDLNKIIDKARDDEVRRK